MDIQTLIDELQAKADSAPEAKHLLFTLVTTKLTVELVAHMCMCTCAAHERLGEYPDAVDDIVDGIRDWAIPQIAHLDSTTKNPFFKEVVLKSRTDTEDYLGVSTS